MASIHGGPDRFRATAAVFLCVAMLGASIIGASAAPPARSGAGAPPPATIRIATFRGEIEGSVTLLQRGGRLRVDVALVGLPAGGVRLVAWKGQCSDVYGKRTSLGTVSPLGGRAAATWRVTALGRNAQLGSIRLRQRGVLLACRDVRTASEDRRVCSIAPATIAGCRATIVAGARAGGMLRQGMVFHLVAPQRRPPELILTEVASPIRSVVLGGRRCAAGGGRTLARVELPTRHGIHRIPVELPPGTGAEQIRSFRFGPDDSLCTDAFVLARPRPGNGDIS